MMGWAQPTIKQTGREPRPRHKWVVVLLMLC